MPEPPRPISIIDARLAEIDRRLGTLQTELAADEPDAYGDRPALAPAPPESSPGPDLPPRVPVPEPAAPVPARAAGRASPEAAVLVAELRELADTHARLLDSMRELVAAYERAIAPPAPAVRELVVSAGPFKSTEALRGFEQTLSRIPEVRGVQVRGYEGDDRAIVDVHLSDATS